MSIIKRWGCRIHQLHRSRVSWYDTKQSDGEAPVMLELCEMQNTPSLPSLPGPLSPRVIAPDRILSRGQIDLIDM